LVSLFTSVSAEVAYCLFSKRIENGFELTDEYQDEVDSLVTAVLDGEIARSDLEKVQSLSILWNAVVKLAKKLDLGKVFTSPDQDYSALPVHISRFIGAFLSAFELILEKNSSLVDELLTTAFDIFACGDTSKQDTIVQLLREYKDWFPFSYMFNRRTGKYPKPCFDLVNQYFNAQRGDSKSLGSEDVEGLEDDDTYGDSIADSLGHDSNFPTVYAPNIMPLKPFSQNEDSENNSQSREYQNAVQRAPSEEDNNAVSTSEEYILKSYYDYSSNWNQNAVEEDEDSDRESSYYVPKPVQKRMTRIKGNRKAGGRVKSNNKKKTIFPSGYQLEQQPLASESFERSASSKTVSFADEFGSTNTLEDFASNIPQLHGTEISQVPKKLDRPPAKVTSDEDEDNVQSFNELQDFSSPERTPRKQQSNTATTVSEDGSNSHKNPARINAVSTHSTRSDSGDDLHFQQEINKLKTQRRLSGDESSIDLSDADRLSPNFATSKKREEERKGNNNISAVISTIPSVKSDWKSIPNRKEHQPPLPEHPEISISKPLSMSRSRSALSDDDEEEEEQRISRKSSSDRKVTYRKDVKTTPDRYRINTNQNYSNEKRIGDVSPPKRVSEISPDKLHRDHFRDESEKTHFNGPDITRFSMDSDHYHQKNQNKGRYRNPLDASLEQQQLQNSGGFPPSSARDWLRESDEFQEKLEEDFQQSYEAKQKTAEGPFVSSPASRISGTSSVPSGSSGSPVRRSFEFNPPQTTTTSSATNSSARKNMKDIASSYEQQSSRLDSDEDNNSPQQESKGRFRRGGSFGMNEEKRSLSRETTSTTTNMKNNKPHTSEAVEKLRENIKKRKLSKEQMNHPANFSEETIVRSKSMETKRKDDHHPDEIEIQPINRNILPLEMIRTKSKLFSSSASRDTADVFRQSLTSKNSFSAAASYSSQVISPLGSDALLPDLKRISSFDLRRANPFSPGVNFQDDLEEEEEERQSPGTQHDPEDDLLEKIQHEKQYQQDIKNRQSMTIVNLSQSMNEQTFYDKPFQELPVNISLPKQTELAMETGIIFEGFLNKKSSSILGQWQKRYFVLKESPIYFCELHIYYQAIESLWGMIPLQLKCSIPIFDISAVETQGKVQAQGKQSLRKFILFISFRFFTFSFLFLYLFSRQRIRRSLY
jgi:hypothetical protein